MKRICFICLIILSCFVLTGCGEKQCVKWETHNGRKKDCSSKTGPEYKKCMYDNLFKDGKLTEECVEWK